MSFKNFDHTYKSIELMLLASTVKLEAFYKLLGD